MNKFITLVAVSVFSSTTVLAETPLPNPTDTKIDVPAQVKESIERAMASTKEAVTSNAKDGIKNVTDQVNAVGGESAETKTPESKAPVKKVAEGALVRMEPASPKSATEAPQVKIEEPIAKKPMMDGQGPHGKMQMMKRPDGPMPKIGIRVPQTNPNFPPKMPLKNQQVHSMNMSKKPQRGMPPGIMGNPQARMPSMNAPQVMMPMMGSTRMGMPNGTPMMPNQGYYMPMMNMQMMNQKQAMMQQHRMNMENRLANIENLLKELVDLQKSKK